MTEDGRKEDEALEVRRSPGRSGGEISDNRILFDPAVAEYSAAIAGHGCSFFFGLLDIQ